MSSGPAEGQVRDFLMEHEANLLPGALEGYTLPRGDGTERNRGNMTEAAKALGLHRSNLYRKMKQLDMPVDGYQ